MNSILANQEAHQHGYDEALLLDVDGFVAEGSGENIFIVQNGKLYEPELTSALDGITRDSVITLAQDMGIEVIAKRITRDELYIADEAFFTGTAAEVTPIRELDSRTIGSGRRGPITEKLQKMFFDSSAEDRRVPRAGSRPWLVKRAAGNGPLPVESLGAFPPRTAHITDQSSLETEAFMSNRPSTTARHIEVTADDLPLHCPMPSMMLWNAHPRVFLPIEKTGEALCPYCGTRYTLTGGAGRQRADTDADLPDATRILRRRSLLDRRHVLAQPLFIAAARAPRPARARCARAALDAPLVARMPEVRRAIANPFRPRRAEAGAQHDSARELARERYDQAIVLPNSLQVRARSVVRGRSAAHRLPRRVALGRAERRAPRWMRKRLPQMAQRYAALSLSREELARGETLPDPLPRPAICTSMRQRRRATLARLGLARRPRRSRRCVPGAEYGPAKRWPPLYFAELAQRLSRAGLSRYGSSARRTMRRSAHDIARLAPGAVQQSLRHAPRSPRRSICSPRRGWWSATIPA